MDSENEPPIAPVASLVDARKRREARAAESAGAERITLTHMTYDPIATVGMTVRNDKGRFEIVLHPMPAVPSAFCMSRGDALRVGSELIAMAMCSDEPDAPDEPSAPGA
jgi:hypothetical protein